ncbi:Gfo/Idh/MocA family protein [Pseudarthrobacter sp. S6]|uniref:Gfo/Idh/MocA family protein n=1 Tax=Pseudarthrobacter sp. S6 TaxID=3418420 RepID=UPI003CEF494C
MSHSHVPIRVAVLGSGFFGTTLALACRDDDAFEVTAICDLDSTSADELARRVGARTLSDPSQLAAAADVDLVMIATPNHTHAAATIALLNAGKSVFVEKPLAITGPDALAAVEAAGRSTGLLLVGHVERTMPGIKRMYHAARSGELGTLLEGYGSRSRLIHVPQGADNWWKLDGARTGGELLHEIHELDLLTWILGDPVEIRATAGAPRPAGGPPEDSVHKTTLKFASGAVAYHELSTSAHVADWRFRISGTLAALEANLRTGVVSQYTDGQVSAQWGIFDSEQANASLRDSAERKQAYNAAGATSPLWMQAAVECELAEIAAAMRGEESVLIEAPATAVVAGAEAMAQVAAARQAAAHAASDALAGV